MYTICKVEEKAKKTSQRKRQPGRVLKDEEESAKGREAEMRRKFQENPCFPMASLSTLVTEGFF